MSPAPPAVDAGAVLAWGVPRLRDLPWRHSRDPWAILVAELMLQQTQVARVVARWGAFLADFPTPQACASSPVAAVVRAWAGLGYNRRAVNLHRAATTCVERHGGRLPEELEDLLALPGVGAYTARAVRAYAYEADEAALDTNVARVLARVAGRALGPREAQAAADAWLPAGQAWAWNQVVMDLGAVVCTARTWRCEECPLAPGCAWRAAGAAAPDPAAGSAFVSGGQSRFGGSDRQGKGRLVAALRSGPVPTSSAAAVAGWPDDPERAARVVGSLVRDGLAVVGPGGKLHLP